MYTLYTLYTLYMLYAHTEGAGQGVGDVCAHTSKNTSKYTDFSYSKYTAMLSSRVLYLHARLRTASIRCKLTPRGLIKAHSMHLLAIGGPMVLGKQVPDHIATANADWKHTTNRAQTFLLTENLFHQGDTVVGRQISRAPCALTSPRGGSHR